MSPIHRRIVVGVRTSSCWARTGQPPPPLPPPPDSGDVLDRLRHRLRPNGADEDSQSRPLGWPPFDGDADVPDEAGGRGVS